MKREPSFLEKLAFAYRVEEEWLEEWPEKQARAEEIDLVIANLRNILRTRKRHGSVVADYGIGDYEDPRLVKESIDVLGREIQQAAVRYEPRLRSPQVKPLSRDKARRIHYQLTGVLSGAPVKLVVVFDTIARAVISVAAA